MPNLDITALEAALPAATAVASTLTGAQVFVGDKARADVDGGTDPEAWWESTAEVEFVAGGLGVDYIAHVYVLHIYGKATRGALVAIREAIAGQVNGRLFPGSVTGLRRAEVRESGISDKQQTERKEVLLEVLFHGERDRA